MTEEAVKVEKDILESNYELSLDITDRLSILYDDLLDVLADQGEGVEPSNTQALEKIYEYVKQGFEYVDKYAVSPRVFHHKDFTHG